MAAGEQAETRTAHHTISLNLPNKLTLARLAMVPAFVVLMSFPNAVTLILAYIVFIVACITDYYDGKIARARNIVTNFGKLLDPVADKVLVASAFVMMMTIDAFLIPGWTIVIILGREFVVTGARSLAASEGKVIAADRSGKFKAVSQMVYILTLLFFLIVQQMLGAFWPNEFPAVLYETLDTLLAHLSLWGIVFVSLVTLYSGIVFARVNWSLLRTGQS